MGFRRTPGAGGSAWPRPGRWGTSPGTTRRTYAAEIIAEHGEPDPADPVLAFLGGKYTQPAYDADYLT